MLTAPPLLSAYALESVVHHEEGIISMGLKALFRAKFYVFLALVALLAAGCCALCRPAITCVDVVEVEPRRQIRR